MLKYVAAFLCVICLLLCGALWQHGNTSCDTFVMPLVPGWSVRFHNYGGRQIIQILSEYNSLPKPLFSPLNISYLSSSSNPKDIAYFQNNSPAFCFYWGGGNYQFGLPCWCIVIILGSLATWLAVSGYFERADDSAKAEPHSGEQPTPKPA